MTDRITKIENLLRQAFSPSHLQVKDQSHLHAGHAGAEDGRGHFEGTITADAFAGRSRIESHRLIYDALGDLMTSDIHALRIRSSADKPELTG